MEACSASKDWFEKFKKHLNVCSGHMSAESVSIDTEAMIIKKKNPKFLVHTKKVLHVFCW